MLRPDQQSVVLLLFTNLAYTEDPLGSCSDGVALVNEAAEQASVTLS